LTFSPDGRYLAVNLKDESFIWDSQTKKIEYTFANLDGQNSHITQGSFSPNGKYLIVDHQESFEIYDLSLGKPILSVDSIEWGKGFVFSPDGNKLLRESNEVYDAKTGELLFTLSGGGLPAYFSPGGLLIFDDINIYDARNGTILSTYFDGDTEDVYSIGISPDGKMLYSGFHDGRISIWGVPSQPISSPFAITVGNPKTEIEGFGFYEVNQLILDEPIADIAWYPGGDQIAAWTTKDELYLLNIRDNTSELSLSYDDKFIQMVERKMVAQGIDDPEMKELIISSNRNSYFDDRNVLKISEDGKKMGIAALSGYKVLDIRSGAVIDENENTSFMIPEEISYDLQYFAFSSTVYSTLATPGIDFSSLEKGIREFHEPGYIEDVAFSHNGDLILTAGDGGLAIWDLNTFDMVQSYTDECYSSTGVFTPDDKFVLTNCGNMNILWDVFSGTQVQLGQEHLVNTNRRIISPNGQLVLDVEASETPEFLRILLRDISKPAGDPNDFSDQTYYYVDRNDISASITGFAFSPHNTHFAVSDSDGVVRIFEIVDQE